MQLRIRPFFLLFAFSNLIIGLLSGLGRLGWSVPLPEMYVHHGAIMVGGFLGSLIALEKVIPLKKYGFFAGPLISASSIVVFLFGEFQFAVMMLIAASLVLLIVYAAYLKTQYNLYLLLAMLGSMCWFIGNVLLLWKRFYPMAFPWWVGFLLFTIVSERLELAKFLPVTRRNKNILVAFLGLFVLGIILPFHEAGTNIAGLSLVCISLWLMRHDVVRVTIKKEGLVRFTGVALLCGYVALLLEGIFLIVLTEAPPGYDIVVHTFFLGFVFAMIFAHGPIILPGILGLRVKPYHPLFYVPLGLLYISLAMRIAADVMMFPATFRSLSGWVTTGSILLYFIMMITSTARAIRNATPD
ncbi:MAG: hypothetical protein OEV74_16955 [Cyclobacteriaceae bacterium]|nr:hypothetical protein [Cyclobacteriaceae bacterium]MDH4297970.1 hypothetical protein [Cyclobacteriaceae bacterium]MDH5249160.1 hypothetical protein [Cyclobacteriaceae bacterium]